MVHYSSTGAIRIWRKDHYGDMWTKVSYTLVIFCCIHLNVRNRGHEELALDAFAAALFSLASFSLLALFFLSSL